MSLERNSPCKINLLLNVLGKRLDGFHELEMVMHPVDVGDTLYLDQTHGETIELSCSDRKLPTGSTNLVHRAAARFLESAKINVGVRIHLEKRIPTAAGLGGGSSNAAHTLLGLNELFGNPLGRDELFAIAASIGSDVPFFLHSEPASVFGRGENIVPHSFFRVLSGLWLLLVHPGFGIATAWAYQQLANFPEALNGKPGRVSAFVALLDSGNLEAAGRSLYNSLEAPALRKYPILALYQDFFKANGALGSLMSGSGSTTFALARSEPSAHDLLDRFHSEFGRAGWSAIVPMNGRNR